MFQGAADLVPVDSDIAGGIQPILEPVASYADDEPAVTLLGRGERAIRVDNAPHA